MCVCVIGWHIARDKNCCLFEAFAISERLGWDRARIQGKRVKELRVFANFPQSPKWPFDDYFLTCKMATPAPLFKLSSLLLFFNILFEGTQCKRHSVRKIFFFFITNFSSSELSGRNFFLTQIHVDGCERFTGCLHKNYVGRVYYLFIHLFLLLNIQIIFCFLFVQRVLHMACCPRNIYLSKIHLHENFLYENRFSKNAIFEKTLI